MPSTGFYLFLLGNGNVISTYEDGVNALNGLLLISSNKSLNNLSKLDKVSMPSTGFYLFLLIMKIDLSKIN